MFSVAEEYRTWLKERSAFLDVEQGNLEFMKSKENPWFSSIVDLRHQILIRSLRKAHNLEKQLMLKEKFGWRDFENMLTVESLYISPPSLLAQTLQSYLNRRGRDYINRYSPKRLPGSVLSLGSVHPTYSSSIISIECISKTIHDILSPFYGRNFQHPNPLTLLWEAHDYMTFSSEIYDHLLDFDRTAAGIDYGEYLFLSGISVPRWAPHQIRVAGSILAHEHFHHVMYLAKRCLDSRLDTGIAILKRRFGNIIYELAQAWADLTHMVEVFRKKADPKSKMTKHWDSQSIAEELICDIAGLVMIGPAFSYALALELMPLILLDIDTEDEFTHPHTNVRLALQIKMLKILKFSSSMNRLSHFSGPLLDFTKSEAFRKRASDIPEQFEGWACSEAEEYFQNLIYFLIDTFNEGHGDQLQGNSKPFFGNYDELTWENSLFDFIDKVYANDAWYGINDGLNPIDVLNAVWLAKELEHNISGGATTAHHAQVAWRLWLTKYYSINSQKGVTEV